MLVILRYHLCSVKNHLARVAIACCLSRYVQFRRLPLASRSRYSVPLTIWWRFAVFCSLLKRAPLRKVHQDLIDSQRCGGRECRLAAKTANLAKELLKLLRRIFRLDHVARRAAQRTRGRLRGCCSRAFLVASSGVLHHIVIRGSRCLSGCVQATGSTCDVLSKASPPLSRSNCAAALSRPADLNAVQVFN